ncbi:plasmid pRiA4b ORF-3 family protein [soil metagenome]
MIPFGPTVHVLRVSLRDVEPVVWRQVVVKSDTPLPKLARTLEQVMGWDGYHLHMFDVAGILFGEPDEDTDDVINEKAATVKHVLPQVQSALRWDYDFGDGWEHDVVVDAIESPADRKQYPVCLDGDRGCPPEDCGGVPGYQSLLAVLADSAHPEYEELAAWAPDGFDPAEFDLVAANRRLRGR